jgi:hypothetical protein
MATTREYLQSIMQAAVSLHNEASDEQLARVASVVQELDDKINSAVEFALNPDCNICVRGEADPIHNSRLPMFDHEFEMPGSM